MKIKLLKNGAYVSLEKTSPSGYYIVSLRNPSGNVHDKIKTDDYKSALEYKRAFLAIGRGLK